MPRRRDDEPEIRFRPPKPKVRNDGMIWATAFKRIMHYARMSRKGAGSRGAASPRGADPVRARFQRCAVRVSYSANTTAGQWRAHGRYVTRESASVQSDWKAAGFDGTGKGIDMARRLAEWQMEGD